MAGTDKNILPAVLFLGLIALFIGAYVQEFSYLNRSLGIWRLMATAAIIGGVFGLAIALVLQSRYNDIVAKIRLFSSAVIIGILVLPLLASLSNRILGANASPVAVIVEAEQPFYSSRFGIINGQLAQPDGYFLFFYKGPQLYRIAYKKSLAGNSVKGDTIVLPIRKGFWGVDWVGL